MIDYRSINVLVTKAAEKGEAISALVLRDQAAVLEKSEDELYEMMRRNYLVMREAVEKGAEKNLRSASGLSGGGGARLLAAAENNPLSGRFCALALARAVACAEYNASMGKIVAAPTAGSCGILPAALITMQEERGLDERAAVMALFTAGGIGMVIANQASISGAECGSAAGMAAAALVEMAGGSAETAAAACGIAIANQMGLVCDPVAGLVETPCIVRNAGGVMCAISAAELALAGMALPIPVDQIIDAMREVGEALPAALRETARGGLATTPAGAAIKSTCAACGAA